MAPRPRLLALHGWRTSAAILQQQLTISGLDSVLRGAGVDVTCLDGPHVAKGPPTPDVQRFFSPPFVEWWDAQQDPATGSLSYVGADVALAALERELRAAAAAGRPVAGLLGFSQGAALAAVAGALQERGERFTDVPPLRCLVLIAGNAARDPALQHLFFPTLPPRADPAAQQQQPSPPHAGSSAAPGAVTDGPAASGAAVTSAGASHSPSRPAGDAAAGGGSPTAIAARGADAVGPGPGRGADQQGPDAGPAGPAAKTRPSEPGVDAVGPGPGPGSAGPAGPGALDPGTAAAHGGGTSRPAATGPEHSGAAEAGVGAPAAAAVEEGPREPGRVQPRGAAAAAEEEEDPASSGCEPGLRPEAGGTATPAPGPGPGEVLTAATAPLAASLGPAEAPAAITTPPSIPQPQAQSEPQLLGAGAQPGPPQGPGPGPVPGSPCCPRPRLLPLLRLPSAHLVGGADPMRGRSEALAGCFQRPLVLRHAQGHVVPRLPREQADALAAFLKEHLQLPGSGAS
ncbi:hypothetical protein HYH03_007686 [Edaphochlamys debaryana]|uniref:Serine hydrolase domain-containing protein n=1 Tax=Edaphochlamys debaryana TaxID=47281 RepID=A0A835Y1D6_9CHLO|nr:hypothetical protein HYH03_007686 [Edaphochlamys debaryana]|eukprot:KAG2494040.1 hypothetical protein HYH03_007686 [Edaphochlamys debaryana]